METAVLAGTSCANRPSTSLRPHRGRWAKAGEACGAVQLTSLADLEMSEKAGIDILVGGEERRRQALGLKRLKSE